MSLTFTKKKKVIELPQPLAPLFDTHAHLRTFLGDEEQWVGDLLVRARLAGVERIVSIFDPVSDVRDEMPDVAGYSAWLREAMEQVGEIARIVAERGAEGLGVTLDSLLDVGFEHRASLSAPALEWIATGQPVLPRTQYLAGVHPYGAAEYTDKINDQLKAMLVDPLCAGIGEIGLDYHFDDDDEIESVPHDVQAEAFARQLELARSENVPVELHLRNIAGDEERQAHCDGLRVLDEVGIPEAGCVLHCFGEERATMEAYLERGCHIAFGGAATFKRNEQVREAFAACPLDRLILETDCPYMAPEPIRGLECEPAMIAQTADVLIYDRADRTGELPEDIAQAIWRTSTALFG